MELPRFAGLAGHAGRLAGALSGRGVQRTTVRRIGAWLSPAPPGGTPSPAAGCAGGTGGRRPIATTPPRCVSAERPPPAGGCPPPEESPHHCSGAELCALSGAQEGQRGHVSLTRPVLGKLGGHCTRCAEWAHMRRSPQNDPQDPHDPQTHLTMNAPWTCCAGRWRHVSPPR